MFRTVALRSGQLAIVMGFVLIALNTWAVGAAIIGSDSCLAASLCSAVTADHTVWESLTQIATAGLLAVLGKFSVAWGNKESFRGKGLTVGLYLSVFATLAYFSYH